MCLKAWKFNFVERACAGHFLAKFPQEKRKEKKGWNFFLLERAGRGGAGRDKKEVKGRGGERVEVL